MGWGGGGAADARPRTHRPRPSAHLQRPMARPLAPHPPCARHAPGRLDDPTPHRDPRTLLRIYSKRAPTIGESVSVAWGHGTWWYQSQHRPMAHALHARRPRRGQAKHPAHTVGRSGFRCAERRAAVT